MTEPIVPAEEENSPTTSMEAPATQPEAPKNDESDFKKMYYREYGQRKQLENEFKSFKGETEKFMNEFRSRTEEEETAKELIASGYDEEEARKLAKAASLINKRKGSGPSSGGMQNNLPYDPEREAFLQKHPEAYPHIAEIDNLKNIAPSRKYETIAQSMGYIEPPQQQASSFRTAGDTQPSTPPPAGKLTPEQEDAAFDEEVDRLFGRKR